MNKTIADEHKKPAHHTANGYQNHPASPKPASLGVAFYLRRFWHSIFLTDAPEEHALTHEQAIQQLNETNSNRITWLGHASFLIRINETTILTDPFLTEFASPLNWAGPRRYIPPGIPLDQLPPIDILIVSHSHYDHLDDETVRALPNKQSIHVVVPLGLKSFFTDRGYTQVTEHDWHEHITIDDLTLTALPSVHDSARSTDDHNQTLWAAWAIVNATTKLLFIGDTAYSESLFKNIGSQYGPFDIAILPIGAYEPRELMKISHVNPEEAVLIGDDIKSNTLIASHWGTINLSDEPPWEPPQRFVKAGLQQGMTDDALWVMKIGETRPF